MTPQEQELAKMRDEIVTELRAVFKANMKVFDWDIPENDENSSAMLIVNTMQQALDGLKAEIEDGRYK